MPAVTELREAFERGRMRFERVHETPFRAEG